MLLPAQMLSHRAKGGKGKQKTALRLLPAKVAVFVNVCCEKPCTRGIVADYHARSKSEVYRTVLLLTLKCGAGSD